MGSWYVTNVALMVPISSGPSWPGRRFWPLLGQKKRGTGEPDYFISASETGAFQVPQRRTPPPVQLPNKC
jgi:hypothetical protein